MNSPSWFPGVGGRRPCSFRKKKFYISVDINRRGLRKRIRTPRARSNIVFDQV